MAGKKQRRNVNYTPRITFFRPDGVGINPEESIIIEKDEIEALRLVDFKKESQVKAARSMEISQPTLSRILGSARSKIAEAVITGKAIKIRSTNLIIHPSELVKKVKRGLFA